MHPKIIYMIFEKGSLKDVCERFARSHYYMITAHL